MANFKFIVAIACFACQSARNPTTEAGSSSQPLAARSSAGQRYDVVTLAPQKFQAVNVAHRFSATFAAADGVQLRLYGAGNAALTLTQWGRDGMLAKVAPVSPSATRNHVEYRHPGMTEWYENLPAGLEQGFTIDERPSGRGRLQFEIAAQGDLVPVLAGGSVVEWRDSAGKIQLRYGKLAAWDATHRTLPTELALRDRTIVLAIDDQNAVFPVMIDPLVWAEQQELYASDAASEQPDDSDVPLLFGASVAISDDWIAVGEVNHRSGGVSTGLVVGGVYLFSHADRVWTEDAVLEASDAASSGYFGASVALDGDTLVVGAPCQDCNGDTAFGDAYGKAYFFCLNEGSWTELTSVTPDDTGDGDQQFGAAVALDGITAVIGAIGANEGAAPANSGSAYVFTVNCAANFGAGFWVKQAVLVASDAASGDLFGYSVSVDGDTIAVGALTDTNGSDVMTGSVRVFTGAGDTWTEQATLLPSDGGSIDLFGSAVSVEGDRVLVGAKMHDLSGAERAGAAYVFIRDDDTWTEEAQLTASDAAENDGFGTSVALSGNRSAIGASGRDSEGRSNVGTIYVFARSDSTWSEEQTLAVADADSGASLGKALDIDGEMIVAGAESAAGNDVENAGAAYTFRLALEDGDDCSDNDTACHNACVHGVCCVEACDPCIGCTADGSGCTVALDDDDACGVIACSDLTFECRTYTDITEDRCDDAACLDIDDCTDYVAQLGSCDDDDPCTENDACAGGNCEGDLYECDDACTMCDGGGGCIVDVDSTAFCDDENPCTTGDVCNAGVCEGGDAPDCDDGNPCTVNTCEEGEGGCVATPVLSGACDDGDSCTEGEECVTGQCVGRSICDDDNDCTDDTCNDKGCVNTPNVGLCEDGDPCTEGDACIGGTCVPGVPLTDCPKDGGESEAEAEAESESEGESESEAEQPAAGCSCEVASSKSGQTGDTSLPIALLAMAVGTALLRPRVRARRRGSQK